MQNGVWKEWTLFHFTLYLHLFLNPSPFISSIPLPLVTSEKRGTRLAIIPAVTLNSSFLAHFHLYRVDSICFRRPTFRSDKSS